MFLRVQLYKSRNVKALLSLSNSHWCPLFKRSAFIWHVLRFLVVSRDLSLLIMKWFIVVDWSLLNLAIDVEIWHYPILMSCAFGVGCLLSSDVCALTGVHFWDVFSELVLIVDFECLCWRLVFIHKLWNMWFWPCWYLRHKFGCLFRKSKTLSREF